MTSISDADVAAEPDRARQPTERAAKEPSGTKAAPFIAVALLLLPLNAGILLYTAKNAADVRESRQSLAALKQSIDGLKLQISKQAQNIAKGAKADDVEIIRQTIQTLHEEIAGLDDLMRPGPFASGGSLIISAPGKGAIQRLRPSSGAVPADVQTPDGSLASIDVDGVSVADLPHYERSVSPEGKLILRKVR